MSDYKKPWSRPTAASENYTVPVDHYLDITTGLEWVSYVNRREGGSERLLYTSPYGGTAEQIKATLLHTSEVRRDLMPRPALLIPPAATVRFLLEGYVAGFLIPTSEATALDDLRKLLNGAGKEALSQASLDVLTQACVQKIALDLPAALGEQLQGKVSQAAEDVRQHLEGHCKALVEELKSTFDADLDKRVRDLLRGADGK